MLAYVGLGWAYVGVCWPHVGLCWPYVEPSWRLSSAYVEDMLGKLKRLEGLYPQNVDYACPPGAHYRHHP